MEPYGYTTELVLVHYVHTDCHLYVPISPNCEQLRAEQLPWISNSGNTSSILAAVAAQRAQEFLRDRIQELIVTRARACHADYPEVRNVETTDTVKMCCKLLGAYPKWRGHSSLGPNLLAEEPWDFANQMAFMSRRRLDDCLVVKFAFAVDPAPEVQSAQAYPFSPGTLRRRPRLLPNSPISESTAVASPPITIYLEPLEGQQQGEWNLDSTTSSLSSAGGDMPASSLAMGLIDRHNESSGTLHGISGAFLLDDESLEIDDSDHSSNHGSTDT